ncbi:MAG: hypothetical protein H6Q20_1235 [Bacteroidetes bacterium]|nr:hypothetical protein [Bacteroidota bacterium]
MSFFLIRKFFQLVLIIVQQIKDECCNKKRLSALSQTTLKLCIYYLQKSKSILLKKMSGNSFLRANPL